MKTYILAMLIITLTSSNAQWVQSGLNPGLGRSLYSDGTRIYASTAEGIFYTDNTGEPWINIGPSNEDIYTVIKTGSKIIAGSGLGHGVYISTDNGQNWYQPSTLSTHTVYALAKNDSFIFAGTWDAGIFRSGDNGETWQYLAFSQKGFKDMITVGNTLYAASPDLYSKIYYTSDNGATWNTGSLDYPASDPLGLFYSEGKLFACDAGLWASTDMGATWYIQYGLSFDSTGYPINVKMFRSITKYNQYLIASVMFESIYISSDNGVSWSSFNDGLINDWTFADVEINGSYIWALRNFFGNAYRRPVSELLTDIKDKDVKSADFNLYQNYPNPFNPSTILRYSIPAESKVTIKVFDLLGTEIAHLVNEEKTAGTYEIRWDASSLPGGTYFYQLKAGSFLQTRKMIFIK